jgi:cytochrome c-type biogenesis protein CcsB
MTMSQLILLSLFTLSSTLSFAGSFSFESLPVQEAGRVKPMVTVAQETLQLIHGKSTYEGKPAINIMVTWMLVPEPWMSKEIIKIDHHGLKEALNFDKDKKYFSADEVGSHPRLNVLFSDLQVRTSRKEKLNAYYQAIQRLEAQLLTFYGVTQGGIRIFPPSKDASPESHWLALRDLEPNKAELFFKILSAKSALFVGGADPAAAQLKLDENLKAFTELAKEQGGDFYPAHQSMQTEVHYQKLKPFFWTWILYLLTALLFALSFLIATRMMALLASVTFVSAFVLHTYGFILRSIITERPPVSNMYETVVWVGWGVVLFAGIFGFIRKKRWIGLVGAAVATLAMMVADFAPVILDSTLQPLEPVLRSNLWLTIHVMTITLSYAAFFLAFGVGDYGVFLYLKDKIKNKGKIRELAQVCYRLIQIGVILLTAGTILGGVWADYSWGRFWGWDPKETWAFIALMGYLAILHARLVGWVKDFGMLAGSIVSFSLVIMAWYGVNFVLGAGLHSYGFGAGGIEYVTGFVVLHMIFVGYAWLVQRSETQNSAANT